MHLRILIVTIKLNILLAPLYANSNDKYIFEQSIS